MALHPSREPNTVVIDTSDRPLRGLAGTTLWPSTAHSDDHRRQIAPAGDNGGSRCGEVAAELLLEVRARVGTRQPGATPKSPSSCPLKMTLIVPNARRWQASPVSRICGSPCGWNMEAGPAGAVRWSSAVGAVDGAAPKPCQTCRAPPRTNEPNRRNPTRRLPCRDDPSPGWALCATGSTRSTAAASGGLG